MPKLWQYLTGHWLTLDPDLARSWWFALAHAHWSEATAWREAFVAFARQDGLVTADVVTDFFAQVATLPQLVALLEALMQEQVLLARDGKRLEEGPKPTLTLLANSHKRPVGAVLGYTWAPWV